MQISRMPIPADDCANSEMSVDSNPADTKSELETTTKINGDSHKKLNGSTVVDDTKEVNDEVLVAKEGEEEEKEKEKEREVEENEKEENENEKEENGNEKEENENEKEVECKEKESKEKDEEEEVKEKEKEKKEEKESTNETESSLPECTEKPEKNGAPPEEVQETIEKVKKTDEEETSTAIVEIPKCIAIKEEDNTPMEIDLTNNQLVIEDVIVKKEPGDFDNNLEVVTDLEFEKNLLPEKGTAILCDEEKIIKSEKVSQKAEEEDICSEISTDTPSPKQVPIKYLF